MSGVTLSYNRKTIKKIAFWFDSFSEKKSKSVKLFTELRYFSLLITEKKETKIDIGLSFFKT